QQSARRTAITHAREEPETFPRDPVRRPFVAEELSPAARPRAAPLIFPVSNGTGAGHHADAILAGERSRPAAHHVVVATMPIGRKRRCRHRIVRRKQRTVLAIGGQADGRERPIRAGAASGLTRCVDSTRTWGRTAS